MTARELLLGNAVVLGAAALGMLMVTLPFWVGVIVVA
jgi:hypothetical protein